MCIPSSIIASRKMYAPPYRYSRFPGKKEGWISEKMDPAFSVGWSVSSISLKIGKLAWRNISGKLSTWNHFRRKICIDCSTFWQRINLSNKNNSIKYRCICTKHSAVMSSQWEGLTEVYFSIGDWGGGGVTPGILCKKKCIIIPLQNVQVNPWKNRRYHLYLALPHFTQNFLKENNISFSIR